jgi:hypothetical protein
VFAGKKSAQIREILISESAWEEMTCLFAPSLTQTLMNEKDYSAFKNSNKTVFSVMEPPTSTSLFNISQHMGPPPNVDDIKKQLFYWTKTGKTALGLILAILK